VPLFCLAAAEKGGSAAARFWACAADFWIPAQTYSNRKSK